jgi:hypothetical protein
LVATYIPEIVPEGTPGSAATASQGEKNVKPKTPPAAKAPTTKSPANKGTKH